MEKEDVLGRILDATNKAAEAINNYINSDLFGMEIALLKSKMCM